eukprot:TRINITY_DN8003_c0_g1_i1.p1 TRINITY_DN8003_c0_g1~~TRINITY_DN8003_c0_g1_i1.p1  ORF type:complete len:405 (+),score=49.01 TRINITY_DN8003_c0_g1_i1:246-1460(+)
MPPKFVNHGSFLRGRPRRKVAWAYGADRKRPEVANVLGARTDGAAAHRIKQVTSRKMMSITEVERCVRDEGYDIGQMTLTILMALYAKSKRFEDATRCYKQLIQKYNILSPQTLNTALYLAVCKSDINEAREVWSTIQKHGYPHTAECYNNIIILHRKLGRNDNALKTYRQMISDGVTPSLHSLSAVLKSVTDPMLAKELIGDQEPDDVVRAELIRILSRAGLFDEAFATLVECHPNTLTRPVVWSQLVSGIAERPSLSVFEKWLKQTILYITHPDIQLYGSALKCIKSILIGSNTDREVKRCLHHTSQILSQVSKHSPRWHKDTLRSKAAPFWYNLFSIYYAAGELGKIKELNQRLVKEGVKIPPGCEAMVLQLEKDIKRSSQEFRTEPIPGKNEKKNYLDFA